jgi:uncharacterized cupin superfamily protein
MRQRALGTRGVESRGVGVAHWDEVEKRRRDRGEMSGLWSELGSAAGSWRAGANRIELQPAEMPTPAHVHGDSEEIFYVLAGSGLTWMDGDAYEIRPGDCIVFKNSWEAHTIRAGDDGLDVIAFGPREYLTSSELPRGRSLWSVTGFVEVQEGHPWDREPPFEWPEPKPERPPTIVNVADVDSDTFGGCRRRYLADAAGSRWTGLTHIECEAGKTSGPFHAHSAEEEIFVVLDGSGTFDVWPDEQHDVRPGSIVAQPPGTGVAHTFRGGEEGLTFLAWGTREPNDICWYPRSRKMLWRGVRVIGRIEQLDYWDGEDTE